MAPLLLKVHVLREDEEFAMDTADELDFRLGILVVHVGQVVSVAVNISNFTDDILGGELTGKVDLGCIGARAAFDATLLAAAAIEVCAG